MNTSYVPINFASQKLSARPPKRRLLPMGLFQDREVGLMRFEESEVIYSRGWFLAFA